MADKTIGIRAVLKQKERILTASRALIQIHLAGKSDVSPEERARLQEPLMGDNAPVFHGPTQLEKQLKKSKKRGVLTQLRELERARNKLTSSMDTHFPRQKAPNRDLLWGGISLLIMPLAAPLVLISPYLLLPFIGLPLFFFGRKVWHVVKLPPYDFTLNAAGVTRAEYQAVAEEASRLDEWDSKTSLSNMKHRAAKTSTSTMEHRDQETPTSTNGSANEPAQKKEF